MTMTIKTQLKAGTLTSNHNEALQVRSALKAGTRGIWENHNEALRVRSTVKAGRAGGWDGNHNGALRVRTALKAGGLTENHSESMRVRTALKAGALMSNHNEKLQRATDRPVVSMRRELLTTSRKEDRLELLVVRAGLRVGRARARSNR
jgi:hypothetical protein